MIKSIEEILSGEFQNMIAADRKPKTHRVLKSTKIEQAIYDDLSADAEELQGYKHEGEKKLASFNSLVNDVFQSIYGLRPRFLPEDDMSDLSKTFNKGILSELMDDDNYAAIKQVCEGKELPAIGATEEFSEKLLENLSSLMNKASGGKGQVNALELMEQDKEEYLKELDEALSQYQQADADKKGNLEKKVVSTANKVMAKKEQSEQFSEIVKRGMNQKAKEIAGVVSKSAASALERAEEIQNTVLAWGNGDSSMQKNPVNTEILKRTAKSYKLRYIAQFLGRYKQMLNSKRLAGYTYARGEKYDIEYGNNISRALTSELITISTPEMLPLFLKKYQSKKLKQYRKREPEYKGKGDIIVCLDESTSTFGENNAYGMAIAMVLYEICRINHTNFALVHFSSDAKVDYFPKDEIPDSKKILDCAETLLGGGTDFERPLKEAFALTSSGKLDKPDIVFITDGECDVSDEFLKTLYEYKADTGSKLTGILLDKGSSFEFSLSKLSDRLYRTSELLEDDVVGNLIEERL